MFSKAYKLKSNNTLKNSEKKILLQRIAIYFRTATEEKAKALVPMKSNITCMKVVLNCGDIISVYVVDNVPTVIEAADKLYPTVCALWKVPDLIPAITIHSPVLSKLQNGAPLYLPGVSVPVGGAGFPSFLRGTALVVNTEDNAAAAVVGRAILSSGDMLLGASGIALETVHYVGDFLCKDNKFTKIERPRLGVPAYGTGDINQLTSEVNHLSLNRVEEEWPSLGACGGAWGSHQPRILAGPQSPPLSLGVSGSARGSNQPHFLTSPESPPLTLADRRQNDVWTDNHYDDLTPPHTTVGEGGEAGAEAGAEADGIPVDMDGLLKYCLLLFIKLEGNKVELPLKTNLLYKNHLMALCPADKSLDVKKSTYKKMSKFLDAMQQEGLLEVRELEKGVWSVVSLQCAHPAVRALPPPPEGGARRPAPCPAPSPLYAPPLVRELYCVTAPVLPLLAAHRKGTALTASAVRAAVTEYVQSRGLHASPTLPRGELQLDAALSAILKKPQQTSAKWEEVQTGVLGRMTPCTEMQFADGRVVCVKTKLEPISMAVQTRSGNKKVTLVSNLEAFGFNLLELSKVCQRGVAASCGVSRSPGAKSDQLQLQGDQTYFVAKLLIEQYGLPKKYVDGADKALKKKNK